MNTWVTFTIDTSTTITWAQMETLGMYWRKDTIYFQRVQALLTFSPSLLAYTSICTILKTTSRNKISTIPSFRRDLCTQTSMWAACRRASSAQSAQTQDHRTDFLLLHLSSEFAVFRAPISLLLPYGSIWLVGAKGSQITRLPEAETLGPQGKTLCRHCESFCCLCPSPTNSDIRSHICLQQKLHRSFKNFTFVKYHTQQSLMSNGKKHFPVLPN